MGSCSNSCPSDQQVGTRSPTLSDTSPMRRRETRHCGAWRPSPLDHGSSMDNKWRNCRQSGAETRAFLAIDDDSLHRPCGRENDALSVSILAMEMKQHPIPGLIRDGKGSS